MTGSRTMAVFSAGYMTPERMIIFHIPTKDWGRISSGSHFTSCLRTNEQNRRDKNPVLVLEEDFISFALDKLNSARKLSTLE